MKKCFVWITRLVMCCFLASAFTFNVFAQSKVDYSLVTKNCDLNRVFEVDVIAEGDASLAAASITVTYDSGCLEYKSVKTADSSFKIEKSEEYGKISSIILYPYGYKFSSKAKLVTFKFRSLESGTTKINLYVSDTVNNNCKDIPIGNVYSTNVTVDSSGVVTSKNEKSSNKTATLKNSNKNKENKKIKQKEPTTKKPIIAEEYTEDGSQKFKNLDEGAESYYEYIIGAMAVIIIGILIASFYMLGKQRKKIEERDKDEFD